MDNIDYITVNQLIESDDREKATSITYRTQNKRSKGDYRPFATILEEELAKEKATKDTDQSSPR